MDQLANFATRFADAWFKFNQTHVVFVDMSRHGDFAFYTSYYYKSTPSVYHLRGGSNYAGPLSFWEYIQIVVFGLFLILIA